MMQGEFVRGGVNNYMQLTDVGGRGGGGVTLELTVPSSSSSPSSSVTRITSLTIDVAETVEGKIQRLIEENPVIIFSRPSCYMCHVMKRLLSNIGVNPTVIELDEGEIALITATAHGSNGGGLGGAPVVFIGGNRVGGLESLMGLHVSGNLVPMLRDVGAFFRNNYD